MRVSSTELEMLPSSVMTSVGQGMRAKSDVLSHFKALVRKPIWVDTEVRAISFIHHSTPSRGKVGPRRPDIVLRIHGSRPCFSKSANLSDVIPALLMLAGNKEPTMVRER